MEGEKKKKKNKKKKGIQNKANEDMSVSVRETTSQENDHVGALEQNHNTALDKNAEPSEFDVKLDEHKAGEVRAVLPEEEVRQLELVKHSWLQKEALLEEELKKVILDQQSWILKEASLEKKIKYLQSEKDSCFQREASLEKQIEQLQSEKGSWIQKEVIFEERINQLQSEKNSWIQKEARLKENIKHLESGIGSYMLKENSTSEMIDRLTEANVGLQIGVKELEESRNGLLQGKRQLEESISILQSRIQHLEREASFYASSKVEMKKQVTNNEDPSNQIEAAHALVGKLIAENATLVEKVNELYIEFNRHRVTAGQSSTVKFDPEIMMPETAVVSDSLSEYGEKIPDSREDIESSTVRFDSAMMMPVTAVVSDSMSEFSKISESREDIEFPANFQARDEQFSTHNANSELNANAEFQLEDSPETYEAGEIKEIVQEVESEIVQVPLEESVVQEVELLDMEVGKQVSVPLSDAPLIGAPFRLISFVAKYVSGADLVSKNSLKPGK